MTRLHIPQDVTRRAALVGGAAAVAAATLPRPAWAQAARLRKNVVTMPVTEFNAYKHAIQITMDRSNANPSDKTGYLYWASLHDNFDTHAQSGCAHFSERFFPWHRRFLYDFEQVLQNTDPPRTSQVMIPYWDWSVPLAQNALYPAAFTDSASPLYDGTRFNASPPPWDAANLKKLIAEADWPVFAGRPDPANGFGNRTHIGTIEVGPHNTLHNNISGDMSSPDTAVNDPIFWSFHGGIDLAWSRWQKLHKVDGKTQKSLYQAPDAALQFRERCYAVGSITTTDALQYDYDYDFSIDKPVAVAALSTIAPPKTTTVAKAQRLAANHAQFTVAAAPASKAANTLLELTDIKVFADKGYRIELFLHPKAVKLAADAPANSPYHVQTFSMWRWHMDMTTSLYVRLSDAQLADLQNGWVLSLQSHELPKPRRPMANSGMAMAMRASKPLPAVSALVGGISLEVR
ncbi:MAG TPA: tyrosinase family protein [Rhizomicrobium sp.]|jgi:tyrosinase|nr:tyrosinase family protein [Rhizomicrobium sp.]